MECAGVTMTDILPEVPLPIIAGSCQSFIVGPNHFQNALLAAYIETHSTCGCLIIDDAASIDCLSLSCCSRHISILFDCYNLSGSQLFDKLVDSIEHLPVECSLALFNLGRDSGIEKKALELGVQGFFYEDDTVETLLKGLYAIFNGEFWVSRHAMADLVLENGLRLRNHYLHNHVYPHALTQREVEILGLLSVGASNDVIADKLCISQHTVRTHLNHIFKKIKVASRLEAAVWSAETLFSKAHP